jgi:tetratricopeptide (TPR) repeat protein
MLTDERNKHREELQKSRNEVTKLRGQVDSLSRELTEFKSKAEERRAKWAQEYDQKIAELRKSGDVREAKAKAAAAKRIAEIEAQYKERLASLNKEVVALRDKVKLSQGELAQVKAELMSVQKRYAALLDKSSKTESQLRDRIKQLQKVSRRPTAKPEKTASRQNDSKAGNPKGAGMGAPAVKGSYSIKKDSYDAASREIMKLSTRNKGLAIRKFEALPSGAQRPAEMLKVIAGIYRDNQDYESAYKLYKEILENDPDDRYAERKLVMTLFDLGRYDEALGRLSGKSSDSGPSEKKK